MSVEQQAMRDALEREAADGCRSFDVLVDALAPLLDQHVRFLVDWHNLKHHPIATGVPLVEQPSPALERLAEQKLEQARALVFARAFFRQMSAREGELRTEAFGGR